MLSVPTRRNRPKSSTQKGWGTTQSVSQEQGLYLEETVTHRTAQSPTAVWPFLVHASHDALALPAALAGAVAVVGSLIRWRVSRRNSRLGPTDLLRDVRVEALSSLDALGNSLDRVLHHLSQSAVHGTLPDIADVNRQHVHTASIHTYRETGVDVQIAKLRSSAGRLDPYPGRRIAASEMRALGSDAEDFFASVKTDLDRLPERGQDWLDRAQRLRSALDEWVAAR